MPRKRILPKKAIRVKKLVKHELVITPPPSEVDDNEHLTEAEKWKDYTNQFNCDECSSDIKDFRIYCRYCEKSSLDEWSYSSYDLCVPCFQRSFPTHHPHPRESFAIKHMSYYNRDISLLIPDGFWDGALMEGVDLQKLCAFCHEGETSNLKFISNEKPLLRLRRAELQGQHASERNYFHRPYFWCHTLCALGSPEVFYSATDGSFYNVAVALYRGKSLKCSHCRRNGATIGCFDSKCDRSYHVTCTGMTGEERNSGMIFWCPQHDRIKGGIAEYKDVWSCDGCEILLNDEYFSCGECLDYYSSFDLCSNCFSSPQGIIGHDHGREQFVKSKVDGEETCSLPVKIEADESEDRTLGPVLNDLYSMDFTSTFLDIHARAPRCNSFLAFNIDYSFVGSTHNSTDFSGTWIPQLPRWCILKYTLPGDLLLSNFLGRGTDAVEAMLLGRNILGIDVNSQNLGLALRNSTAVTLTVGIEVNIQLGDARNLENVKDSSISLVLSHPPYHKCIPYSSGNEAPGDLSRCDKIETFITGMACVARESWRVLKPGCRALLGIGDNRESRNLLPVTLETLQVYLQKGFVIEEFMVKRQRCCSGTGKAVSLATMFSFLLMTHELMIILRKGDATNNVEPPIKEKPMHVETIPIKSSSSDGKFSQGTIWCIPEEHLDNVKKYIEDSFISLYGVQGTVCQSINTGKSYKDWLPSGPFVKLKEKNNHNSLDDESDGNKYERMRREKMLLNRNWFLLNNTKTRSDELEDGQTTTPIVSSILLIHPGISDYSNKVITDELASLPIGGLFIVGTRDYRTTNGSYNSTLLSTWQYFSTKENTLKLREIVYIVPPGWTRHQKYYTPSVNEIGDWRPIDDNLEIVHLSFLVYTKIL